jgi:hypothetical protein
MLAQADVLRADISKWPVGVCGVLVLLLGLVAGTVGGVVGFGTSIMLMPALVLVYGPREAVPIMAVAAIMVLAALLASPHLAAADLLIVNAERTVSAGEGAGAAWALTREAGWGCGRPGCSSERRVRPACRST